MKDIYEPAYARKYYIMEGDSITDTDEYTWNSHVDRFYSYSDENNRGFSLITSYDEIIEQVKTVSSDGGISIDAVVRPVEFFITGNSNQLGYSIKDINGDGHEELIILSDQGEDNTMTALSLCGMTEDHLSVKGIINLEVLGWFSIMSDGSIIYDGTTGMARIKIKYSLDDENNLVFEEGYLLTYETEVCYRIDDNNEDLYSYSDYQKSCTEITKDEYDEAISNMYRPGLMKFDYNRLH
ncbi:MAG: hypothetical protein IJ619_12220 [Eubacterium sp.]|nr:hypothetical protein [Eubacterium sp.]